MHEMMCDGKPLSAILRTLDVSQHASSDVEKMILGNKCDMTDRRQVSKDRGEKVRRFSPSGNGVSLIKVRVVRLTVYFLLFQLAIDYGVKFMETSAKSSLNVEEVSCNVKFKESET